MKRFMAALLFALSVSPGAALAQGALYYSGGSLFGGGGGGGVSSSADLSLDVGTKLIFDADTDSNNYLVATNDALVDMYIEAQLAARFSSGGMSILDDKLLNLGTSADCWLEHETLTTPDQTEFECTDVDGGTLDGVIWYRPQGTNQLNLGTGTDLIFGNAEFIHNDTDNVLTFGSAGGANNEDLTINLGAANTIAWGSNTGASTHTFPGLIAAGSSFRAGSAGQFYWLFRAELSSPADGQVTGTNDAATAGATLDFDDAAGTIVVKDQAGTGAGNLIVTGATDLDQALRVAHIVIDCDDDPYTVPETVQYVTVETGTGTCTGNMDVTLFASDNCTTSSQDSCPRIHVTRIGAVQVDIDGNAAETINGSATYSLTSDYQSATLVETNSASTDWIVE
jgi:hypothetical protein